MSLLMNCKCEPYSFTALSLIFFWGKMLHGKHVMVRVGGGWDTLQGFLLKYDPCRILQFATLEQKILAFQKGFANDNATDLPARTPKPPEMNPLSAVDMFQKQKLKPGTPVGTPKIKEKQVHPPDVLLSSSLKGACSSPVSVRSKLPNSPAGASRLYLKSSKSLTKKPPAPTSNASSSVASSNPAGKSTTSQALSKPAPCVSESLKKCVSSPHTPKAKLIPAQNSRDMAKSVLSTNKYPEKKESKHLKHNHVSSRDTAVSHSATHLSATAKCTKLPKGNIHIRPKPPPSFQSPAKITKSSSKTMATDLGVQSQPAEGELQTGVARAQTQKSTSNLNQPLSATAARGSREKNMVSVVKKKPQTKSSSQKTDASSSRSPGRIPLSIMSLPQSPAKTPAVQRSAMQMASKGPWSTKDPPQRGRAPASSRKPPSSGLEAAGDEKPTAKKKDDDDHYFVMTGSKKPRK